MKDQLRTVLFMAGLALGCSAAAQNKPACCASHAKPGKAELRCKLMPDALRERKNTVLACLRAGVLERKELDNGYSFRFDGSNARLNELMEFTQTERECCDFFTFSITLSGDKGTAWLDIVGPEGAKEVIVGELEL